MDDLTLLDVFCSNIIMYQIINKSTGRIDSEPLQLSCTWCSYLLVKLDFFFFFLLVALKMRCHGSPGSGVGS